MKYRAFVVLWGLALLASLPHPLRGKTEPRRTPGGPTRFEYRHVHFHVDDSIVLEIAALRGELLPALPAVTPDLDDRRTLLLRIEGGEAAMSAASFTDLLNRYV